jgi:hypothetical protein
MLSVGLDGGSYGTVEGALRDAGGRHGPRRNYLQEAERAAPPIKRAWQSEITVAWSAAGVELQTAAEIPVHLLAPSMAVQQACALSQTEQVALVPPPPAAPLVPPVAPIVPPVAPVVPPDAPVVPPDAPVVAPVPVPPVPLVPPAQGGIVVSTQISRSAHVVLERQAFPAMRIALWLEQAPPVLVVSEVTQPCTHSAIVAPASAPHCAVVLVQPCMQRLMTLPALGELEPHPCTTPSARPVAKRHPTTDEISLLDIALAPLLL